MPLYPPVASTTSLLAQGVRFWYRLAVLATVPLGYWRLGEPSGTTAIDEMGAYDGTYVSAPTLGVAGLLTGDLDTAMTGDGTASSMTTPTLPGMAAWSVAFWAKSNGDGAYYDPYFSTPGVTFILSRTTTTPVPATIVFYESGWVDTGVTVATTATAIIVTYDVAHGLTIYKNGVQAYNDVAKGVALPNSALYFGHSPALNQSVGDTMDELAVWDRRLSPAEPAALYRIGSGT